MITIKEGSLFQKLKEATGLSETQILILINRGIEKTKQDTASEIIRGFNSILHVRGAIVHIEFPDTITAFLSRTDIAILDILYDDKDFVDPEKIYIDLNKKRLPKDIISFPTVKEILNDLMMLHLLSEKEDKAPPYWVKITKKGNEALSILEEQSKQSTKDFEGTLEHIERDGCFSK